jgi:hypothetical protein
MKIKIPYLSLSKNTLLATIFLVSGLIWSFVTPLGASPDEGAHVQYAQAIIQGDYSKLKSNNWLVKLPANVATINDKELCYFQDVKHPNNCYINIDSRYIPETEIELRVPGYPPTYYLGVGWLLKFGFSNSIWYLMRLMSVLICSLIIALTFHAVRSIIDRSFIYGISLAVTPLVSFFVGSVTPSSLEIICGISFAILLFSFRQLKERNLWGKYQWAILCIIGLILSWVRPISWIFLFSFLAIIFMRNSNKFHPLTILASYVIMSVVAVGGIVFALKKGLIVSGRFMPPALPNQIVEAHFSTLDNYIYDSVGYFAWIMSYKGIELIHIFWIGLIILLIAWSLQQSTIRENISLLAWTALASIVIPLSVYYVVFKAGYGYQARYAMAMLCAIPIMATLGTKKNLEISVAQSKIVSIFVPTAYVSDWLISGFRYSHGLPFQFLSWGNGRTFTMWLSKPQILVLLILIFSYFALNMRLFNLVKQPS